MFFTSISLKRNRILILVLFHTSLWGTALGQIQQVNRFEIAIKHDENEKFSTVSAGESGLMIYRRLYEHKLDKIELIRIDTALHEVWRKNIDVAKDLFAVRAVVKENFLFILFKSFNYLLGDFQIVVVDVADGAFTVYSVSNIIPFNPSEFIITNQAALIGGYFNYRPLMLYFNFGNQTSRILPGFFNEPGELTQVKAYEDGSSDVIVSTDNYEKKKCLWIRNYDASGELIKTTVLQPEDKKNFIFGRSIKVDDEQLVVGVYGRYKEYSRGIFIARIDPNGEYKVQYYDYADLQHFFNYMKAPKEKRIKGRIERKRIKGKKVRFNYRFIVHEIIKKDDQFIMLGEAFYPQYAYPNGFINRWGIPQMNSHSFNRGGYTLIGYHYTHAVVIGFNENGSLLWDNSFEVNDVMTPTLEQFVKIQPLEDKIMLQYVFDDQIRTKLINGSEIIEGKSYDKIKLRFEDDILKSSNYELSKLDYWYDGHLYVYGVQQIRNWKEAKVNANRKVFFINKIQYK